MAGEKADPVIENRVRQLEQSEKLFKNILNKSQDLICIAGMDGYFKYTNPAWEKIVGYTQNELLSKPFLNFIHPEDHKANDNEITKLANGHYTINFENRYIHKDGSIRRISWSATPVPEERIIHCIGRDVTRQAKLTKELNEHRSNLEKIVKKRTKELRQEITERKQAEERLRQSEQDLKASQQIAHLGSWRLDLANNQVVWTDELYKMYGFDPTLPVPPYTEHMKLFTAESWERLSASLTRTSETGIPYELELETVRKDESNGWMWVRGETITDSAGNTIGLWGAAQDITERKVTEERLRKRENYYRTILQTALDGFWITDTNGHFLEVNDTYSRMSGYSQDELLKMRISDIEANENPEKVRKHLEKGITIGYDRFETVHRRKDGSLYPVEVNFTYSNNDGGRFIVFAKDISIQKQAEKKILKNQYYLTKAQEIGKIGTWELDIQKKILIWTDENYKIFGVPLGTKLSYEIFLNCIHPDDRGYVNKKWNEALKNNTYDIMHRVVVDNKIKWVREKADIEFDSEGKPTIAIGFTQDLTDLKQIENALQESKEKFETMFERAPLSYQSLDENGNFVEVNQTWLKTMGYTRDEVLGRNFSEFLVPEWKTHFKENFPRFKAVGEILGVEFEMVKKDGSIILVSFHGKIGKNEKGNFQQTHCIFQDITTNQMIQKESERNKTILMESEKLAGFGGWQWDIEKDTWTMSQNWLEIHGCTNPNLATDELIKIAHPNDRLKIQTALNNIVNNGGKYDIEYRIVHQKTGEIKYIHAHGEIRPDDTGRALQVFGAAQDITDRKQSEESSKRLKERLESLWNITKIADSDIKTISDHVLSEVQKMTLSQYAFYGFLDENENEMVLHAWSHETMSDCETNEATLHFPVDKAGIWAEAIRKKKILTINDFNLDRPDKKGLPDGHVQLNRLMAVPYIKGDKVISIVTVANKAAEYSEEDEKQVQAFMGNVQLLIDRKTAEQEKIDLLSRLQQSQKMESIGNLAGGIAHDFNNLLFPIIGMAEILLEDLPTNSLEHENAQEIYDAGKRAGDLVQQILAFSRRSEHKMVPVRVQNILKEVLKLSRSTIPTDIEIHQDIQSDCGSIRADATQIHQVLMNLITNAYHAVQEKRGMISVQLKQIRLDGEELSDMALKKGQYIMLSVLG